MNPDTRNTNQILVISILDCKDKRFDTTTKMYVKYFIIYLVVNNN